MALWRKVMWYDCFRNNRATSLHMVMLMGVGNGIKYFGVFMRGIAGYLFLDRCNSLRAI